jgi:hypothetical protein
LWGILLRHQQLEGGAGFLSWSQDHTLRLWGPAGEKGSVLRGHHGAITGALALEGGAGFLSWSNDCTLRFWGPAGEKGSVLHGHEERVNGALVLEGDAGFLSWSRDGTLRLWSKACKLLNAWLSPSGAITHVEAYGLLDHYLVVFGGNVGIVRLASVAGQ